MQVTGTELFAIVAGLLLLVLLFKTMRDLLKPEVVGSERLVIGFLCGAIASLVVWNTGAMLW